METVELEIAAAIHQIIEEGGIENELIDVDKVTSLRDPDLDGEVVPADTSPPAAQKSGGESGKERTGPTRTHKQPTPSPSLKNYYQGSYPVQPPSQEIHSAPVISIPSSPEMTGSPNKATQIPSKEPLILSLPWYIWFCIFLLIVVLGGLKVSIDGMLQKQGL